MDEGKGEKEFKPAFRQVSRAGNQDGMSRRRLLSSIVLGFGLGQIARKIAPPPLKKSINESGVVIKPLSPNSEAEAQKGRGFFEEVFKGLDSQSLWEAHSTVDEFKKLWKSKVEYPDIVHVVKKNERFIRKEMADRGLLAESGEGIVFVENGGGEDKTNATSGARGVAQLMKKTALSYGMRVDDDVDERANPIKSIEVMAKYLRDHKKIFAGNEGLTIWSYHAGVGNVMQALQVYFLDTVGIDIGDYGRAIADDNEDRRVEIERMVAKLIPMYKVNVHRLFSNRKVNDQVISKLEDMTQTYVYHVVAGVELLSQE